MNYRVLTKRDPFIDVDWLANLLRIEKDSEDYEIYSNFCITAKDIAVPKAIYKASYIEEMSGDTVKIDNISFKCELMVKNFSNIHRVFPFAVTCGKEVYQWAQTITDVFEGYWAENIMEAILRDMINHMNEDIKKIYGMDKLSCMNPGSLEGWPIEDQKLLFELIGDVTEHTDITLTDSCLMVPQKSVSGILFASDVQYSNCKLCERKNCPSRRDEFDTNLYNKLIKE